MVLDDFERAKTRNLSGAGIEDLSPDGLGNLVRTREPDNGEGLFKRWVRMVLEVRMTRVEVPGEFVGERPARWRKAFHRPMELRVYVERGEVLARDLRRFARSRIPTFVRQIVRRREPTDAR